MKINISTKTRIIPMHRYQSNLPIQQLNDIQITQTLNMQMNANKKMTKMDTTAKAAAQVKT
jgi:hypothetical protein